MSNLLDYFLRVVTGKYTTLKIHTELHQGPEWCIFHILTGEDIDDVISLPLFHSCLCKQSVKNGV